MFTGLISFVAQSVDEIILQSATLKNFDLVERNLIEIFTFLDEKIETFRAELYSDETTKLVVDFLLSFL